ncbi:hypothetical protein [Fulvivirga sp.]|uniref:hypothetical protein n=2 Tax=Fulvivirga sp. TaxID=1931237 RepID=UPI0032EF6562
MKAQELNLHYIHSAAEARSNVRLDTIELCDLYILNGIPFKEEDFKAELSSYKLSDLKFSKVLNTSNTTFFHKNCDYVMAVGLGKYEQTKEEKQEELDSIRANLNRNLPNLIIRDYICSDCKQVTVDGRPLWVYDAKDLVNNLKVEEIDFIMSYEYANPEAFGRNAKNGLIEIFLTKKAAKRRSKNSKKTNN